MNLDKLKTNILSNPEFLAWAKYVDDFYAKHPDKTTSVAPSLMKYFRSSVLFNMAEAAKGADETKSNAVKLEAGLVQRSEDTG